jgi:hypothetical protein
VHVCCWLEGTTRHVLADSARSAWGRLVHSRACLHTEITAVCGAQQAGEGVWCILAPAVLVGLCVLLVRASSMHVLLLCLFGCKATALLKKDRVQVVLPFSLSRDLCCLQAVAVPGLLLRVCPLRTRVVLVHALWTCCARSCVQCRQRPMLLLGCFCTRHACIQPLLPAVGADMTLVCLTLVSMMLCDNMT